MGRQAGSDDSFLPAELLSQLLSFQVHVKGLLSQTRVIATPKTLRQLS